MSEKNWQQIKQSGLTVCLYATPELLCDRIKSKSHRPLMEDFAETDLLDRIKNMLLEREFRYSQADYKFESKQEVPAFSLANKIFEILRDDI